MKLLNITKTKAYRAKVRVKKILAYTLSTLMLFGCANLSSQENQSQEETAALDPSLMQDASGFTSLYRSNPDVLLEPRYYSSYNFLGQRMDGYEESTILLSNECAQALKKASDLALSKGLRLKVYTAYLPQRAIDQIEAWKQDLSATDLEYCFYPNLSKEELIEEDYLADKTSYSTGGCIDLTLFDPAAGKNVDMAGSYDVFDSINLNASLEYLDSMYQDNRQLLLQIMSQAGFEPLQYWWAFRLKDKDPDKADQIFDFPINENVLQESAWQPEIRQDSQPETNSSEADPGQSEPEQNLVENEQEAALEEPAQENPQEAGYADEEPVQDNQPETVSEDLSQNAVQEETAQENSDSALEQMNVEIALISRNQKQDPAYNQQQDFQADQAEEEPVEKQELTEQAPAMAENSETGLAQDFEDPEAGPEKVSEDPLPQQETAEQETSKPEQASLEDGCVEQAELDGSGFVDLGAEMPDLILEPRYNTTYNILGQRIAGYQEPVLLTARETAEALATASEKAQALGYRLKIFDAYRPNEGDIQMVEWCKQPEETAMQPYFYPNVNKADMPSGGYMTDYSLHNRGSALDMTLFDMETGQEVDMGTPYDFLDESSHIFNPPGLSQEQMINRNILQQIMVESGFRMITTEWWHFELINEPYPSTYFNFPAARASLAQHLCY